MGDVRKSVRWIANIHRVRSKASSVQKALLDNLHGIWPCFINALQRILR
jgi:hypothetical protein